MQVQMGALKSKQTAQAVPRSADENKLEDLCYSRREEIWFKFMGLCLFIGTQRDVMQLKKYNLNYSHGTY